MKDLLQQAQELYAYHMGQAEKYNKVIKNLKADQVPISAALEIQVMFTNPKEPRLKLSAKEVTNRIIAKHNMTDSSDKANLRRIVYTQLAKYRDGDKLKGDSKGYSVKFGW